MSRHSRSRRDDNRKEREQLGKVQEAIRKLSALEGDDKEEMKRHHHDAMKLLLGGKDPDYHLTQSGWQSMSDLPVEPGRAARLGTAPGAEHLAMLLAGFLRCAGRHCGHLPGPDRSLFVFLGARVASCKHCLPRFLGHVREYDRRVKGGTDAVARQCDFCLANDVEKFRELRTAYLGIVYLGDACDRCAETFGYSTQGDSP